MVNKNKCSWFLNKIEKCNYCENKAEYILLAKNFFGIRTRQLCNQHKQEWYNATLNV